MFEKSKTPLPYLKISTPNKKYLIPWHSIPLVEADDSVTHISIYCIAGIFTIAHEKSMMELFDHLQRELVVSINHEKIKIEFTKTL